MTYEDDGANTYDYAYEVRTRREEGDRRGRRPHSYDYFAFGNTYGTPTENVTQPFRFLQ